MFDHESVEIETGIERPGDALLDEFIPAGDTPDIDAQEHVRAAAGPGGDLCCVTGRVQPRGDAGMTESYGRAAIELAASSGLSADWRALAPTRP
jgi:hypothetical protein